VATRLVDALLRVVLPGGVALCPTGLAFTQPTPEGRALAEKVTGTRALLVYT
jgi:hypothetical protein